MAIYAPRFDLVGTFACHNELGERETEGLCTLDLINYSQPAVALRRTITLFTTKYSLETDTASMFSFRIKQRNRQCTTGYSGDFRKQLDGIKCSTFNTGYSPLFYNLASAAAEVGYFTTVFPPPTLTARGYFVAAKTSRLLKILMVDRKVGVLPPGISEFYHGSQLRHTSLSEDKVTGTEPGVLFIYLTTKEESECEFPQGSHVPVERNGQEFIVPSALGEVLDIMYPSNPSSELPPHMILLLKYFQMLNKYQEMEESVHNKHFVKELDGSNLAQLIDVLVGAVDLFKPGVVRMVLEVFGKKLNALGGIKTVKEYGDLMGFIVKA